MSSTLAPALTVVVAALVLQTGASVLAPKLAPSPRPVGLADDASSSFSSGPGLSIPGLARALRTTEPSPSSSFGPAPTSGRSEVLSAVSDDDDDEPESFESRSVSIPTATPGVSIAAAVRVSAKNVAPGGELRYRYVATNTGNRRFNGTLTLTTHTPAGTLRCSSDLGGACLIPGDYDNGSRSPDEAHMNPEAVTKQVSIGAHRKAVLFVMRVQVSHAADPGLVLRNHSHIRGTQNGRGPITAEAPPVRVSEGTTP